MTIHLMPEQERRIQAVLSRGAYESVEEVVEAALTAVEQRTMPVCRGTGRSGHFACRGSRVKATRGRRANTSFPPFIDGPHEVMPRRVTESTFAVQIETKRICCLCVSHQ